jgi:hypothetical protein
MFTQTRHLSTSFLSTIDNDEAYHGQWWLAMSPTEKIHGVLNLRVEGGVHLSLLGAFSSSKDLTDLKEHEVILGTLIPGGTPVTLVNCIEYQRKDSLNGGNNSQVVGRTQKFRAEYLIFNYHNPDRKLIKFRRFTFGTTYLVDFVRPQLIQSDLKSEHPVVTSKENRHIEFEYLNAKIAICSAAQWGANEEHTESITEYSWIEIKSNDDVSIEEFKERYQTPLLNLVQFGISYLNSITFFKVYQESNNEDARKVVLAENFKKINRSKERVLHDRLFGLDDMVKPEALLKTWLQMHEQHRHIFDLYFSSIKIDRQFTISRFLSAAQALESYHFEKEQSGNFPSVAEAKSNFKNFRNSVLNTVLDEELKAWLVKKLLYNTDLRHRLNDLLSAIDDIIKPIVSNKEIFISKVVCTRNYYTHYNPSLKRKSATGEELEALMYALRIVLNIHLMLECGIDFDKCHTLIERHYLYSSVLSAVKGKGYWKSDVVSGLSERGESNTQGN